MNRMIVAAAAALALVALAAPATAKHKKSDDYWQPPWAQCNGWNCDQNGWQPGWQNGWQPGWQPGWQQGRQPGWGNNGWGNNGWNWQGGGSRLVSQDYIVRQLRQSGYERIYDIRLDDDRVVYIARAWDHRGRLSKVFFDARNGRFISRQFAD